MVDLGLHHMLPLADEELRGTDTAGAFQRAPAPGVIPTLQRAGHLVYDMRGEYNCSSMHVLFTTAAACTALSTLGAYLVNNAG